MSRIDINSYLHLVKNTNGIQDWTEAINQSIVDAKMGDSLYLPNIIPYNTFSSIVVNKAIAIEGGAKIVAHHSGTALVFKPSLSSFGNGSGVWGADTNRLNVDISVEKKTRDWNDNSVGIHIFNSYFGIFKFPRISGFTTGLILTAEKVLDKAEGSSYNTFYIGRMENHRYGVILRSRNLSGWVTENTFYGGSLGSGVGVPNDNFQVCFDSDESGWNNNNKFYNVSFEGFYTRCLIGNFTMNNDFYSCRYEMPYMTELVNWGNVTQSNGLFNGYGLGGNLDKIVDNGRYNRVSASGYKTGYIEYFDKEFFSFINSGSSMNPIAGKKVNPIGNKPLKNIYVTDGVITLDLSIARDFYISVQSNITTINFINIPSGSKGLECQLTFSQENSLGYSITGFPSSYFKFGKKSEPPIKRSWGIDVYSLKNISNNDPSFVVLNQYSQ